MKTIRLAFLSFLVSATALVLSDQIIYKYWLVPRLASLHHIPFYYHYFVLLPIALAIIIFGLTISSWKKLYIPGFIFALTHQCYDFFTTVSHRSGDLIRYATEDPVDFWIIRSLILIILYLVALGIVWYSKFIFQKTFLRFKLRTLFGIHKTAAPSRVVSRESAQSEKSKISEDSMPKRITYHVLPDPTGWLVKKGKAKKASSVHKTKRKALHAASDLAKNHQLSQVIIHKASGVIESDRTFEHRHYRQKRKKREVIRKIKRGMRRSKRKDYIDRLRRRKAAQLGIARLKRKRYLRRIAARKAARRRKRR
jgi:hypothetical protein